VLCGVVQQDADDLSQALVGRPHAHASGDVGAHVLSLRAGAGHHRLEGSCGVDGTQDLLLLRLAEQQLHALDRVVAGESGPRWRPTLRRR
jgi:hypothetical protein